jgi:hypothetical protein
MSSKAAQHVLAVILRRVADTMKTKPDGKTSHPEEVEAWGKQFLAAIVSGTVGACHHRLH